MGIYVQNVFVSIFRTCTFYLYILRVISQQHPRGRFEFVLSANRYFINRKEYEHLEQ